MDGPEIWDIFSLEMIFISRDHLIRGCFCEGQRNNAVRVDFTRIDHEPSSCYDYCRFTTARDGEQERLSVNALNCHSLPVAQFFKTVSGAILVNLFRNRDICACKGYNWLRG